MEISVPGPLVTTSVFSSNRYFARTFFVPKITVRAVERATSAAWTCFLYTVHGCDDVRRSTALGRGVVRRATALRRGEFRAGKIFFARAPGPRPPSSGTSATPRRGAAGAKVGVSPLAVARARDRDQNRQ